MATDTPTRSCIAIKNEALGVTNGEPGYKLDIKVSQVANEKTRLKVEMLRQEHGFLNQDPAPYPGDDENPFWKVITGLYENKEEVITGLAAVAVCIASLYVSYKVRRFTDNLKSTSKAFMDAMNEGVHMHINSGKSVSIKLFGTRDK